MNKVLFISIKPEFSEKIFDGSKTIELRKSMPNVKRGNLVVVYSTNPEKAVIGICRIGGLIKTTPQNLWDSYSEKLGIDYHRFQKYYKNSNFAVGLVLTSGRKLSKKISLDLIKKYYPSFNPPQTYKYFDKNDIRLGLRRLY